jgi:sugar phosphate isomerase/epimerase
VEDTDVVEREIEEVLPRVLETAARLECRRIVVFGFERQGGEAEEGRARAMRAFERCAERCKAAGAEALIENEPAFWVDRPAEEARLLEEVGHPALGANWDPANAVWGGADLNRAAFEKLAPFIRNVHVKDYTPDDEDTPWRPLGEGVMAWPDILRWVAEETNLEHVVLETHCKPLVENTHRSLRALREMLGTIATKRHS